MANVSRFSCPGHGLVDQRGVELDLGGGLGGLVLGTFLSEPMALFNHSCDASGYLSCVLRPGRSPVACVKVTRDLAAGDEVTLNYGPVAIEPSCLRVARLEKAYHFTCADRLARGPDAARLDALLRPKPPTKRAFPEFPEEARQILDHAYLDVKLGALNEAGKRADRARDAFAKLPKTRSPAREKRATSANFTKAPISVAFHSFRLTFGTSDHISERSRSVAALSGTRARGTPTSKRRRSTRFPPRHSLRLHLALLDVLIAKRADLPEAPAFARELLATLDAHDDLATLAADPVLLARVRRRAGKG